MSRQKRKVEAVTRRRMQKERILGKRKKKVSRKKEIVNKEG